MRFYQPTRRSCCHCRWARSSARITEQREHQLSSKLYQLTSYISSQAVHQFKVVSAHNNFEPKPPILGAANLGVTVDGTAMDCGAFAATLLLLDDAAGVDEINGATGGPLGTDIMVAFGCTVAFGCA